MSTPIEDVTIPVLLCIDVEPDEREVDPGSPVDWAGFERTIELIDRLRPRMEAATGRSVHVSWFVRMDPQITHVYGSAGWVADRYCRVFDALVAGGDELGLHVHPWQWDRATSAWMQNFADQSWVSHCVESAFAAFEQAFGGPCRAFRFGDRWMNDATIALIDDLGATCDLTVEPGRMGTETPEAYIGTFPDYSDVPRCPYRPSMQDFRSPVPEPVLDLSIIPMSCAPTAWASTKRLTQTSDARSSFVVETAADYEGSHDVASMEEIAGWVWDRNHPGRVVDVEIMCDGGLLATVGATARRQDLADAAKGDGRHAFRLATPSQLKDGRRRLISARVAGTGSFLNGSPLALEGTVGPDSDYLTICLDHPPLIFELLVDRSLVEPNTTYLNLKVRSDFGNDEQRSANFVRNVEHLLAHPLAPQFDFTTPTEFLARVSS